MSKLSISWIARDSFFFVCSKKLSDSVNFRNYFRIDQIPRSKLFLKFEPNQTTFYYIQISCYLSLFTEWTHFRYWNCIIKVVGKIFLSYYTVWVDFPVIAFLKTSIFVKFSSVSFHLSRSREKEVNWALSFFRVS